MQLRGKNICAGYAYGKIVIHKKSEAVVVRKRCDDPQYEIDRFDKARQIAKEEYDSLYNRALEEVGNNNAALFRADAVLLDDADYIVSVKNIINTQKVNAEYAVAVTIDNFTKMMSNLDDAYIRERSKDVADVFNKVIEILSTGQQKKAVYDEPVILFATDLTPSEIVMLDKNNIGGFVMMESSSNSHTAILSRSLNIPSLIGVDLYGFVDSKGNISLSDDIAPEFEGKMAIIDGYSGRLIVEPTKEELAVYQKRMSKEAHNKKLLDVMKGKETVTKSGVKINLYANINDEQDVATALINDAEGAGLYRSEYLYMAKNYEPTEGEQVAMYRRIVENMGGKKLIIRTADIGADKPLSYMEFGEEPNPALGYRGIRVSLENKEMFITQLRAIYRASYYGNIAIMFPMITSVDEVVEIKRIVGDIKDELAQEGYPYRDCELGIMIETPAAVMISDLLAKEVDFFSIGTNDLAQYTLAVDRTNSKVQKYYNPHHESILRMIKLVIDNGHANDCRVSICGEMASDPEIVRTLVEYGIDEISVSPTNVLFVREIIRNMD